jgi:hypothetical protein
MAKGGKWHSMLFAWWTKVLNIVPFNLVGQTSLLVKQRKLHWDAVVWERLFSVDGLTTFWANNVFVAADRGFYKNDTVRSTPILLSRVISKVLWRPVVGPSRLYAFGTPIGFPHRSPHHIYVSRQNDLAMVATGLARMGRTAAWPANTLVFSNHCFSPVT